jgi:hypothetical protein
MGGGGGGGSNLLDMGLMVAAGIAAPEVAGAIAPELMGAGGFGAAAMGAATGAGLSGLTAAATGQNPLKAAEMGALGGAVTGYMPDIPTVAPGTPTVSTLPGATVDEMGNALPNLPSTGAPPTPALSGSTPGYVAPTPPSNMFGSTNIFSNAGTTPANAQLYTSAGIDALGGLSKRPVGAYTPPNAIDTGGSLSKFKYDPNNYSPDVVIPPSPLYQANYSGMAGAPTTAAEGGIMSLAGGGKTYSLGDYSDGGRLLKGPGDGMSDDIPATIGHKQEARLADGEFVVPADVVSGLGNGSTDAGAKHLYKMMDKVRHARTGRKTQGKQIEAEKYVPA